VPHSHHALKRGAGVWISKMSKNNNFDRRDGPQRFKSSNNDDD
jgi:hypothetical protein